MVHEHESVGLNNYERKYFQKHFGNNLKRLMLFRKAISKEQSEGFYSNNDSISVGACRTFIEKGGKHRSIWLTRKKIDAYINEITKNI